MRRVRNESKWGGWTASERGMDHLFFLSFFFFLSKVLYLF